MPGTLGIQSSSSIPPTTANNWSYVQVADSSHYWVSCTEIDGTFLSVCTPPVTNRLAVSTDGINWTLKNSFDTASMNTSGHIQASDGLVFACFGDEIYKSSDKGSTWSLVKKFNNANIAINQTTSVKKYESGTNSSYFGYISAIGTNNSVAAEWCSTDYGATWSNGTAPAASPSVVTSGTPTDGNTYIVAGLSASPYIQYKIPTSSGTWTNASFSGAQSPTTSFSAIHYADHRFVAIDSDGKIFSTTPSTGMTFYYRATLSSYFSGALTFGDGCWVAQNSSNKVTTSYDAITWTESTASGTDTGSGTYLPMTSMVYGSGKFVSTGQFGGNIISSNDESSLGILSGGTTTISNGYRLHKFTAGTTTLTKVNSSSVSINYLVVAGGGSGGGALQGGSAAGGGGAGGVLTGTTTISANQTITVGNGGTRVFNVEATGSNGGNSSIGSLVVATGGGGGGASGPGSNGGSGGGAGAPKSNAQNGGTGVSGQGNAGGNGLFNSSYGSGGGGGGANAAGTAGNGNGGKGGDGKTISVAGTNITVGGGGGGANSISTASGGSGGGGASANGSATAGTAETGGGGGASFAASPVSGAGGSGVIYVWYTAP